MRFELILTISVPGLTAPVVHSHVLDVKSLNDLMGAIDLPRRKLRELAKKGVTSWRSEEHV